MDIFVFSKKGDQGETSLLSGARVSKASLRPEAYGTLDEASSALGLAGVFAQDEKMRKMIREVQEDLITLGAELSCEDPGQTKHLIEPDHAAQLEHWIEQLQQEVPLPRRFVLPGGNAASAALDLARTIVRRAERRVVALREAGQDVRPEVHAYLNRLADFLFTAARHAAARR